MLSLVLNVSSHYSSYVYFILSESGKCQGNAGKKKNKWQKRPFVVLDKLSLKALVMALLRFHNGKTVEMSRSTNDRPLS